MLSGHKAGALNLALRHTRKDAEIVGIIDADYTVSPTWLCRRVPDFADPAVALSQAPQAHRDGARSLAAAAMDAEADGFFDAGMVQRQRDQVIVVHRMMLLLRRAAIEAVGGWAENQICEDTELGLRLQAAGWRMAYAPERLGHGLLPDDLDTLGRQRWHWACGGIALLRRHVRLLLPRSPLSPRQRWYAFASGLHWVGEAATVAATTLAGLWGLWLVLGLPGSPPDPALSALLIGAALASWIQASTIHGPRGGVRRVILAGAAAAAAQMSAAQGAIAGLMGRRHGQAAALARDLARAAVAWRRRRPLPRLLDGPDRPGTADSGPGATGHRADPGYNAPPGRTVCSACARRLASRPLNVGRRPRSPGRPDASDPAAAHAACAGAKPASLFRRRRRRKAPTMTQPDPGPNAQTQRRRNRPAVKPGEGRSRSGIGLQKSRILLPRHSRDHAPKALGGHRVRISPTFEQNKATPPVILDVHLQHRVPRLFRARAEKARCQTPLPASSETAGDCATR